MKKIKSFLHLDRHTFITLVLRFWSVLAGVVNLAMVPTHLSAAEQGYYYTYISVIALQVFFELGLNQILVQFTSHEIAHLDQTPGALDASSPHYKRLISLVLGMSRWYVSAAVLFGLLVGIGGFLFFRHTGTVDASIWAPAWFLLVSASAVNLWLSPRFAFLEGCGRIGDVAKMRVIQAIIGYGCMWLALLAHAGLAATPLVPLVASIFSVVWLRRHGGILNDVLRGRVDPAARIRWREEVIPLQWRISLSWVSSYLIFNLFTPFVFARTGEVEAGKVGMSLAIFNSITSIGMSWINAKSPRLSMLAAVRKYAEMKHEFWLSAARSLGAIVFFSACFLLLSTELRQYVPRISARLLSSDLLIWLAAIAAGNCCVFSAATFMRAFKKEPMLMVSVVTSLFSAGAIYAGSGRGVATMLHLYSAAILLLCLPWTAVIFVRFYRNLTPLVGAGIRPEHV